MLRFEIPVVRVLSRQRLRCQATGSTMHSPPTKKKETAALNQLFAVVCGYLTCETARWRWRGQHSALVVGKVLCEPTS